MNAITVVIATAAGFLMGSIPFSSILLKLLKHKDIRNIGDGNPGAVNAWKGGGACLGLLAGFLDFLKGGAPAAMAMYIFGVEGWGIVPVALAPIAGHAFSPFLGFRGGKALAATFGAWSALTLYEGPVVFGLLLALFYFIINEDAWSVIFAMLGLLIFLVIRFPEGYILATWTGNFAIVSYRHYPELAGGIHIKNATMKSVGRKT